MSEERLTIPLQPKKMREANSRELLRLLRQHAPCSRADLVRLSGLTAPTVSSVIESLHRTGLVKFVGDGKPNGGRPPLIVDFRSDHAYVVGVDVGGSTLRIALADLNGKIVARWERALGTHRTPKAVADLVASAIQDVREEAHISAKKIIELAAGAPGITDVRAGRVLSAPNLTNWHDVPLREMLEERTGLSTTVENDVNLAALGENWCGVARNVRTFVFLAVGTGVGAGIVVNGQLHHGANWSAGEVGYLMLPGLPAEPLSIDRLGALESSIGGRSIENAWHAKSGGKNGGRGIKASEIFATAAEGNRVARELLLSAAEHLATAITNMSLVLDMSLVVLGGGVSGEPLLHATMECLARNEFARPKVVLSSLGRDAQLHGAVRLALLAAEMHGYERRSSKRDASAVVVPEAIA